MLRRNRLRNAAGFSLMELLVVLVLVGVFASLAVPAMTEYVSRHKTRGALDRLAADVAFARMAAVRSGGRAALRFEGANAYHIELTGSGPARTVRLGLDYAGIVVLPPSGDLVFNSRGLLVTDPGHGYIVVSLGEARDSLMITPAGRVYRDY